MSGRPRIYAKMTSILIQPGLMNSARALAKLQGMSLGALIRALLLDYVERHMHPNKKEARRIIRGVAEKQPYPAFVGPPVKQGKRRKLDGTDPYIS